MFPVLQSCETVEVKAELKICRTDISLLYLPHCVSLYALVLPLAFPLLLHLLADLLVALRGDEHLDAGLIHIIDIGPVSLDLGVFYTAGQAVDGPRCPGDHKHKQTWVYIYTVFPLVMLSCTDECLLAANITVAAAG